MAKAPDSSLQLSKTFRFAMSTNFSVLSLLVEKRKKKKRVLRTLFAFFLEKNLASERTSEMDG